MITFAAKLHFKYMIIKSFAIAYLSLHSFMIGNTTNHMELESEEEIVYEKWNNDTLIFASIIFRHGNATATIPGQPLRNTGIKQLYNTGKFFRRRYDKLLRHRGYSFERVYILSTDTERSIMSAQACSAVLFPLTDRMKWNDEILWHPIPVHTLPIEMDDLFRGGRPCPKYDVLYKYYMSESPDAVEIFENFGYHIENWSRKSGQNLTYIDQIADLYRVILHRKTNKELRKWEREAIGPKSPMENISNIVYKLRGTPELVKLRCGFLIKKILRNCGKKINSTLDPDHSLHLYSTHSSTIMPILNGLGIQQVDFPPYGSSLHFELYRTKSRRHYLQLFYRKPDEEYPEPLNVPGLGVKWDLMNFYSEHGDLFPGKFSRECSIHPKNRSHGIV